MKTCIITFCNKNYLTKAEHTINDLKQRGYNDDIVLIVGNDLKDQCEEIEQRYGIIVKHFPDIDRSVVIEKMKGKSFGDGRQYNKTFQWHKIHCFNEYFKQWDVCMIIDAGMWIFKPVDKFFNLDWKNKILAHSDAYPEYTRKLDNQFENFHFDGLFKQLEHIYDLYVDYFQSTVMLFDTDIIKSDTIGDILELADTYYNCKTNEQGILNLYFKDIWEQLQIKDNETYYYDFCERDELTHNDYIMLKYPRTI